VRQFISRFNIFYHSNRGLASDAVYCCGRIPTSQRSMLYAVYSHTNHFTMKMDAAWTSKAMASFHKNTLHHNPEKFHLKHHCRENLKTRFYTFIFTLTPSCNIFTL